MEPLKRFTQCGSLTMLFAVFIVLFGVSSTALTTFGKSPNQAPPPPPTPPPVKARECTTHSDCSSIQHTSCVRDGSDRITRCLCGNNKAPVNGQCNQNELKQLRHLCTDSDQCDEELICGHDNATKTTGFNRNPSSSTPKICLCDEDGGYTEDVEDNNCNDAGRLLAGVFVPLTSLILGIITSKRQIY